MRESVRQPASPHRQGASHERRTHPTSHLVRRTVSAVAAGLIFTVGVSSLGEARQADVRPDRDRSRAEGGLRRSGPNLRRRSGTRRNRGVLLRPHQPAPPGPVDCRCRRWTMVVRRSARHWGRSGVGGNRRRLLRPHRPPPASTLNTRMVWPCSPHLSTSRSSPPNTWFAIMSATLDPTETEYDVQRDPTKASNAAVHSAHTASAMTTPIEGVEAPAASPCAPPPHWRAAERTSRHTDGSVRETVPEVPVEDATGPRTRASRGLDRHSRITLPRECRSRSECSERTDGRAR